MKQGVGDYFSGDLGKSFALSGYRLSVPSLPRPLENAISDVIYRFSVAFWVQVNLTILEQKIYPCFS
jgi:hypothetical protein